MLRDQYDTDWFDIYIYCIYIYTIYVYIHHFAPPIWGITPTPRQENMHLLYTGIWAGRNLEDQLPLSHALPRKMIYGIKMR